MLLVLKNSQSNIQSPLMSFFFFSSFDFLHAVWAYGVTLVVIFENALQMKYMATFRQKEFFTYFKALKTTLALVFELLVINSSIPIGTVSKEKIMQVKVFEIFLIFFFFPSILFDNIIQRIFHSIMRYWWFLAQVLIFEVWVYIWDDFLFKEASVFFNKEISNEFLRVIIII